MWHQQTSTLAWAVLAILITLLGRFLANLYYWRRLCHDKPGPPHHFLWGHLAVIGKVLQSQPSRAAPQSIVVALQRQYDLPDCFCLDPWPFGPCALVATHPVISNQFTVKPSMPKHPAVTSFTEKFGGRSNMVAADGPEWRIWRSAFNPGFSAAHLMTLMPVIVDDVKVFCDILEQRAREERPFRLEHLATRLTIDIIGKIVLDTRFNSQVGDNELVSAFERQVRWMPVEGGGINLLDLLNPLRPIIVRYNSYIMNRYVSRELENRFAAREQLGRKKHVIDLAMETYLKETNNKDPDMSKRLDKTFKTQAIANIEIFLFAGHDTSSSAICYALYHLGRDKEALATARKEIVELFGPDPSKIGQIIKDDPWLLNKMDYGLAVIREVLRLYPPASSVRMGSKDCTIIDPETNQKYPTENFMLWASNVGIHRNPKIWTKDNDEFKPERWLDPTPNTRAAHHDANVAFSKGQRNCIGQELALLELRMVLAMTVTRFDFRAAFDELDQLRGDGSGYPGDASGVQEQFGEQAYQIQLGTAKPREGLPCRVRLAV